MKRFFIFLLFVSAALFPAVCPAAAADPVVNIGGVRIRKVLFAVSPADRQECMRNKESWGLKHCLSGGRDYLAGAAKACGGLQNLPTGKEAKELAMLLYGDDREQDALYGPRDNRLLEQIGLPSSYDHLYVWLAGETVDGKGGYIRMFADKGSIPYYAHRDGSGYVSSGLGLIRYKSKFGFQTTRPNAEAPSVICVDRSRD